MKGLTRKKDRTCETCDHCVPVGEGDHICLAESEPTLVLENYTPTDEYIACKGKSWEKKQ